MFSSVVAKTSNETQAQPPLTRASCAANFSVETVMCKFTRRSAVGCSAWLDDLTVLRDIAPHHPIVSLSVLFALGKVFVLKATLWSDLQLRILAKHEQPCPASLRQSRCVRCPASDVRKTNMACCDIALCVRNCGIRIPARDRRSRWRRANRQWCGQEHCYNEPRNHLTRPSSATADGTELCCEFQC